MYGDFSRQIGEQHKHYSQLLQQQGRLLLDADVNELGETVFRYLHQLVIDVIGPYGTAVGSEGFEVTLHANRPHLGPGFYYLSGRRCEHSGRRTAVGVAPDGPPSHARLLRSNVSYREQKAPDEGPYLVFLRAWERTVTASQDPDLIDVAFEQGVDTVVRSQLVWQVLASRTLPDGAMIEEYSPADLDDDDEELGYHHHHPHRHGELHDERRHDEHHGEEYGEEHHRDDDLDERHQHGEHHHDEHLERELRRARRVGRRALRAWRDYEETVRRQRIQSRGTLRASLVAGSAPYVRNELHRVEVHHGGGPKQCSFKHSHDNGATLFRFSSPSAQRHAGTTASASGGGTFDLELRGTADALSGLAPQMWLEYVDDLCRLPGEAPMLQITAVHEVSARDGVGLVTVEGTLPEPVDADVHPVLRQWDHHVRGADLRWEPVGEPGGESGERSGEPDKPGRPEELQAQVQLGDVLTVTVRTGIHAFHSGDHWLLATRTRVGGLAGPGGPDGGDDFDPPQRFDYHEAPLAIVTADGAAVDLRATFYGSAIWEPRVRGRNEGG